MALKTFTICALAAFLTCGLVACSSDGNNLPTAPEAGLTAGFSVTIAPPATNDGSCRIRFVGNASGGSPGYAFAWDFGAIPPRVDQRIGRDTDSVVEFTTTSSKIGSGSYGVALTVTDKDRATARASGFMAFSCAAGSATTTFTF